MRSCILNFLLFLLIVPLSLANKKVAIIVCDMLVQFWSMTEFTEVPLERKKLRKKEQVHHIIVVPFFFFFFLFIKGVFSMG